MLAKYRWKFSLFLPVTFQSPFLSCLHCPPAPFHYHVLRFSLRLLLFFMCWQFASICGPHVCLVFMETRRGLWICGTEEKKRCLWDIMLVLEIEHRSCRWAASALEHWAISPVCNIWLYIEYSCVLEINHSEKLWRKALDSFSCQWTYKYSFLSRVLLTRTYKNWLTKAECCSH